MNNELEVEVEEVAIERKPKMALRFDADDEYVCDEKLLKEGVFE